MLNDNIHQLFYHVRPQKKNDGNESSGDSVPHSTTLSDFHFWTGQVVGLKNKHIAFIRLVSFLFIGHVWVFPVVFN